MPSPAVFSSTYCASWTGVGLGMGVELSFHDGIGLVGVGLLLAFQAAFQFGRLDADSMAYSVGNAVGAGLVVLSLVFEFNLSAFLVEASWTLVSIAGIVRHLRRKRRKRQKHQDGPQRTSQNLD